MRAALGLALALCATLALPSCGGGEDGGAEGGGAPRAPLVSGTALDAATGEVLAGVRVRGPREVHAISDREGRFALEDLREGDSGEVVGTLDDGRIGRVRLRPLESRPLVIVLRLERP